MDTRQYDLQELREAWHNVSLGERKVIERSGVRIRKETKAIKDMRERLVKEHRQGNVDNIKDIQDFIEKKQKYQNNT